MEVFSLLVPPSSPVIRCKSDLEVRPLISIVGCSPFSPFSPYLSCFRGYKEWRRLWSGFHGKNLSLSFFPLPPRNGFLPSIIIFSPAAGNWQPPPLPLKAAKKSVDALSFILGNFFPASSLSILLRLLFYHWVPKWVPRGSGGCAYVSSKKYYPQIPEMHNV